MLILRSKGFLKYASFAGALILVVYIFWALNRQFFYNSIGYDESFFVWGGWCITKGLAPYRDFIEFKPPLVFVTHALALKLHGFDGQRYRWFFAYFPAASLIALLGALVQRGIDNILALAVVTGVLFLFLDPSFHDTALSDSESIGLTYYLFGISCLLIKTSKWRHISDIGGGFFLSCCVLSKEPFAGCIVLTWLACFLANRQDDLIADLKRSIKFTLVGIGIVVAAVCLYMVPTGSMKHYVSMAVGYARIYRDAAQSYCVVLGRFHPSTKWNELITQWGNARGDFVNMAKLGFLMPLFVFSTVFVARRSWVLLLACFGGLVAALYAVTASNCQWPHYYNMTVAGVALFLAIGADSISQGIRGAHGGVRTALFGIVVVTMSIHVWPTVSERAEAHLERPALHEPAPGVFAFIRDHTTPEDRIFTTGAPLLYVEMNRVGATRESNIIDEILGVYPDGTDEERLKPLYDQLVLNRPKVFVLDPEHQHRRSRHMRALITPFLTKNNYRKVNEYLYERM